MRTHIVLGVAVVALLAGCDAGTAADEATSTSASRDGTTSTVSPVVVTAPADSDQDAYDSVLSEVGVVVADAPSDAVVLADAEFCGWMQAGPIRGGMPRVDLAGQKCFVQAHLDGRSALFLVDARTNEGDPTPYIFRTDDGRVTQFVDSTRDNYATRGWSVSPCDSFYIASYDSEAPPRLTFACYPWDELGQL